MPIHNLDKLFYPRSVAVIGATDQDDDPGHVVMHNLLQGGFQGPILPVTDCENRADHGRCNPPIAPDLASPKLV